MTTTALARFSFQANNQEKVWEPAKINNPALSNSEKREMLRDAREASKQGRIEESLSIFPNKNGGGISATEAIAGGLEGLPGGKGLGTVWTFIFNIVNDGLNPHSWAGLGQTQEELRIFRSDNPDKVDRVCMRCHTSP